VTSALLPATGGAFAAPPVAGADLQWATVRAADSAAATVVSALAGAGALAGAVVATHLTGLGPAPHVTLSVEAPGLGPAELAALLAAALPGAAVWSPGEGNGDAPAAADGAAHHAARSSGRAVHFPGVERLVGTLAVDRVLALSDVAAVHVLGGTGEPDREVLVVTRNHVRPTYDGGRLMLAAEWAAGGTLVPFETPTPTPCCADHA